MVTDQKAPSVANTRIPISSLILDLADHLYEKSNKIADRVCQKLEPIMAQSKPTEPKEALAKEEVYPPFFSTLRAKLQSIDDALLCIEDAISRVEL